MVVELLPHQKIAIEKMHNGCVLTGGVGTGKTVTSLGYFWIKELHGFLNDLESIKTKKDIYIFTTARKRDDMDWQEWGIKFGLYREKDISTAGIQLTVDSYNNIEKYKDVKNAFIILDEQRMVGSGKWSKTFIRLSKSNRWIMLSATPGDRWEDYIPLFIANGFYKNRTEFVREHCIYSYYGSYPKLERYIGVNKLVSLRNSILVEMPYERHTVRHIQTVPVSYDKAIFDKVVKKRWNPYTEKPLKDVAEMYSVMRKVVNSDTSRLTALQALMQKHPRLIVFYTFNYELEILRGFANSMGATSSTSSKNSNDSNRNSQISSTLESSDTNTDGLNQNHLLNPNGTDSSTNDPWIDTIWAKDYIPPEGQPDPRKSVSAIKARAEFERKAKRTDAQWQKMKTTSDSSMISTSTEIDMQARPPIGEKLSENGQTNYQTTVNESESHAGQSSGPTRLGMTYSKSSPYRDGTTRTETSSTAHNSNRSPLENGQSYSVHNSGQVVNGTSPSEMQPRELDNHIPRSSLTESNLSESSQDYSTPCVKMAKTESSLTGYEPEKKTTLEKLSTNKNNTIDMDQSQTLQKSPDYPNSWSGNTDESSIQKTTNPSDLKSTGQKLPTGYLSVGSGEISTDEHTIQLLNTPDLSGEPQMKLSDLTVAEWNGQKHEPVPDTERWLYFVQYAAGAEAWNCTTTDAMVFYSRTYVYRQFMQSQGRIDRLNTPFVDLYYYDLASKSYIDWTIGKAQKEKRDFNYIEDAKEMAKYANKSE